MQPAVGLPRPGIFLPAWPHPPLPLRGADPRDLPEKGSSARSPALRARAVSSVWNALSIPVCPLPLLPSPPSPSLPSSHPLLPHLCPHPAAPPLPRPTPSSMPLPPMPTHHFLTQLCHLSHWPPENGLRSAGLPVTQWAGVGRDEAPSSQRRSSSRTPP